MVPAKPVKSSMKPVVAVTTCEVERIVRPVRGVHSLVRASHGVHAAAWTYSGWLHTRYNYCMGME